MKIWIVLPAFNEAGNLGCVLEEIKREQELYPKPVLETIVVNDGSTDSTAEEARSYADCMPLEILENEQNMGLAFTFRRGMTHALHRSESDDVIICMDADNTHLIGQVHSLFNQIRQGRDVVIASRYQPGSVIRGVPMHRQWASTGMMLLFRLLYPVPLVRDYSCGYRAYRATFLKAAFDEYGQSLFPEEGFACMVALLIHCHKKGAVFGEIPMVLRYDQKTGESKMPVISTIIKTLKVLFRARFGRTIEG